MLDGGWTNECPCPDHTGVADFELQVHEVVRQFGNENKYYRETAALEGRILL